MNSDNIEVIIDKNTGETYDADSDDLGTYFPHVKHNMVTQTLMDNAIKFIQIKALVLKNPNDTELGAMVRRFING